MSDFAKWFEAQHGKRPGLPAFSDERLQKMAKDGKYAERTLAKRAEWDARRQSALCAWQARERATRAPTVDQPGGE